VTQQPPDERIAIFSHAVTGGENEKIRKMTVSYWRKEEHAKKGISEAEFRLCLQFADLNQIPKWHMHSRQGFYPAKLEQFGLFQENRFVTCLEQKKNWNQIFLKKNDLEISTQTVFFVLHKE
jgi:hypothetical protein